MILADTSVWIDHLRKGELTLVNLLQSSQILIHPCVVGELALGALQRRAVVLGELTNLPVTVVAEDDEVLRAIDRWRLFGIGIGYVDAHLLTATALTPGASLWTRDKRLREVAQRLHLDAGLS